MVKGEIWVRTLCVYVIKRKAYVNERKAAAGRCLFWLLYPSSPLPIPNYLLFKQFRAFKLPDKIIFPREFPIATNLRSKLKRFQDDTLTESYHHCKSIYYASPLDQNVTLAKLLMSMRATARQGKQLFLLLEQDHDKGKLIFHFNKNTYQQAFEVISTLPLFIEAVLGEDVAKHWFMEDVWYDLELFKYELVDPLDPMKEVKIITTKTDNWNNSDSDFKIHKLEHVDDEEGSQILITNFDMVKMETKISHPLGNDGCLTWLRPGPLEHQSASTKDTSSLMPLTAPAGMLALIQQTDLSNNKKVERMASLLNL